MATWVSGEWYKLEGWPAPSWDQGGKWDAVNQCWKIDRDGLYLFSVVIGATIIDISTNDQTKIYIALTTGDPDDTGLILAAGTDIATIDAPYVEFNVHGWRPFLAGVDIFTYGAQISGRGRDITIAPSEFDYFSYNRMGRYPM